MDNPIMNNDEDDQQQEQQQRPRKKKKVKIMSDSGQTDSDRRLLRNRQRKLQEDIINGIRAESTNEEHDDDDDGTPAFQKLRKLNNTLWDQVRYTREAVLDSENVDLIAANAARQAESLVQIPRYDAVRFATALSKKASVRVGSNIQFGWRGFGSQIGICFNSLPSHVSFLYGPLDAEYKVKERKKPERRQKQIVQEEEEDQHPEDLDQTQKKESDGNELSAVEQHMIVIQKTLKNRAKEEVEKAMEREDDFVSKLEETLDVNDEQEKERIITKKLRQFRTEAQKVNAVKNLFNPQSFTQTVENVFHFSFLIKSNKAAIEVRDAEGAEKLGGEPGPVIRPLSKNQQAEMQPPRQAIVSLNMKDWRDMCKAYQVEASDVPHRGGKTPAGSSKKRKSES